MNVSQRHRPLSYIIAGWWQGLFRKPKPATDSEDSRMDRLERAAKDFGLTTEEVITISVSAYYTTDLLPLRMSLLHLDADKTADKDLSLFRALAKSCKLCDAKGQCAWDIAHDPANPQWQQYCPNAVRLCAMQPADRHVRLAGSTEDNVLRLHR